MSFLSILILLRIFFNVQMYLEPKLTESTYFSTCRLVILCGYSIVRRFATRISGYHKAGIKRASQYVASSQSPVGQKGSRMGSNHHN